MDTLVMMSCSLISSIPWNAELSINLNRDLNVYWCVESGQNRNQCYSLHFRYVKLLPTLIVTCAYDLASSSSVQLSVPWCQKMSSHCTLCLQAEWLWSNRCWSCSGDYKQIERQIARTQQQQTWSGYPTKEWTWRVRGTKVFLKVWLILCE